ncbi:MAG TPA: Verru_Chthon cassette protein A [Candidatus Methylacidiphilales bacterium]|nr:Verru_Chthon cassette protein A [Candidatus Methylacidiphilales bacterium]
MRRRHPSAGIALVMVLICLTLLSILTLAFISSVSTDLDSSSSFAASSDARQRSQTAVNLVIGQIQEATLNTDNAWSSQPGMIRTFSPDGTPAEQFKLYSATSMVEKTFNATTAGNATDVPSDWMARPAEYVDLNQPVLVQNPTDGTIISDTSRPSDKYVAEYPIIDPDALGIVKGFSIDVNGDGISETAPASGYNPITSGNPVPMPVQWLYMLQDGSLRTLDPASKTFTGGTVDASNPPVARIAFWTDDETCKVNINTAAGDEWNNLTDMGSFSDMPMANNIGESALLSNQPVTHEFQRYPGHPATTYLSAVFPHLTRQQICDIIPRISWDTKYSNGGTVTTTAYLEDGTGATKYGGLPLSDGMPLYASVDELRYVRSTMGRTAISETILSPHQIDYSRFFLTAGSRAPEINLFNRPRVTIWPEPADPINRSLFDRSIAFCSTVAEYAFYFVRSDSTSSTFDYVNYTRNQEIYKYLQDLTALPVPGFGGTFLAKYGADRDQILTEIFDYIRSTNLADASGSKAYTYEGTVNNLKNTILRSATPGIGHVVPIQIGETRGFGRSCTLYQPIIVIAGLESAVDDASLLKDKNGDGILKGTGNKNACENAETAKLFTKKVQAMVLFDVFAPGQGIIRLVPNLVFRVKGLNKLMLDGQNLGFPSDAQMDLSAYTPNNEYAWGGYMNYANFFWDLTAGNKIQRTFGNTAGSGRYPFLGIPVTVNKEWKSDMQLSGASGITVEIYSRDKTNVVSTDPIQTIELNFPPVTVPTPLTPFSYRWDYTADARPVIKLSTVKTSILDGRGADSNLILNAGYNCANWSSQIIYDVSRSLAPSHGDYRLIAAQKNVPATAYVPGRGYETAIDRTYSKIYYVEKGEEFSGGMVGASPRSANGGGHQATSGKLVAEATYKAHVGVGTLDADYGPAIPSLITADKVSIILPDGTKAPGDWDNGMGGVYDGPYVNRPDEGERGPRAYGGYGTTNPAVTLSTLFSPNRQAPSPIIFGSLSTGVKANKPWQTLLFCPNPAAKALHPGSKTPPDHLLLDLFTMPVVEPYAISEPFSTAGKINMNYQIVPFTYITRSTALQAVLRSARLTAIPTTEGPFYKTGTGSTSTQLYRVNLDLDETMKGFQRRFDNNEIFKSASQICEMFLVPRDKGATIDNIATWWDNYKLTGDNMRERPYANLYSRLTTKSNTYTVYVRVQSLQKAKSAAVNYSTWVEGTDKVLSEYRGSVAIERFLNPNLKASDYNPSDPLTAYKFRTLFTKQFAP